VEKFNRPERTAGSIAGEIGFYTDLVLLPVTFTCGILMDKYGRTYLSISGLLLFGGFMIVMPYISSIYPGILLTNIGLKIGFVPSLNSPICVDYIAKESLGATVSFLMCVTVVA
jgi:hypothetical protein